MTNRRFFRPFAVLILAVFALALCAASEPPADLILVNARIYTVDAKQPWAEAIAIRGGKILAVGESKSVEPFRGPATRVIDAGHRLVLPGFTDCHVHFADGSLSLLQVKLANAASVEEIQKRVKDYAAAHLDLPWIEGRGWAYTVFPAGELPDKKYLDQVVPDRPVYLESFDGHTWWANSRALQIAGITKAFADPPGGTFVRDPKTGEPTGAVKEDSADDVMRRVLPKPNKERLLQALRQGMVEANRVGLARIISPDGVSVQGGDFEILDLYDELRRNGQLTLRFDVAKRIQPPELTAQDVERIEDARRSYHDDWIHAGEAKFFLDGVIETRTAAMLAPYTNEPSSSGHLLWDPGKYKQAVAELDKHDIQIFTHAIGDRAIRLALDGYENAQQINRTNDRRHRIEHIEDASAADLPRFGKLGVIASFQPLHAYPDDDVLKVWTGNIGEERAQRGWAWRSVKNGGGVLAFGSDWPIVTQNPWAGVQNAVTRQTTDGNPEGGWHPRQRLSLAEAIRGYTLDAAFAGHREQREGSLEPGKVADLIVVSQDLFKIEPTDIIKTEVLLTIVGGKIVYESPSWKASAAPRGKP